ncbi:hypothetical protein [Foetidibacter luteolus]|uniref:hypothetical protein n=1 Tax=Foetidibacter luteolus TaxID=2608880 RepID=UPI00129B3C35|nr:hypothetical protein [Foetidibacter luteolus]
MFIYKRGLLCAAIALCMLTVSCSKDDDTTPPKDIQLANNATLGAYLTDKNGMTLYYFTLDGSGASACAGGCIANWPVYYQENPTLADGLHDSDFAVITRTDGAKQTTYKGWPLYYFVNDKKSGDVNGEAVNSVWFAAKPDYSVMLVNAQLVGHDGKNYKSDYTEGDGVTQYLTDEHGRTLYAFAPDKFNTNTFTKPDLSNNAVWPMYERSEIKGLPSTLTRTDFDTIHVHGKIQMTFKGWPLYYFGQDNGVRGSNKGISFPRPGIWPVVNNNSPVAPN